MYRPVFRMVFAEFLQKCLNVKPFKIMEELKLNDFNNKWVLVERTRKQAKQKICPNCRIDYQSSQYDSLILRN